MALTDSQITEFMTAQNGFDNSAVYTTSYLNDTITISGSRYGREFCWWDVPSSYWY